MKKLLIKIIIVIAIISLALFAYVYLLSVKQINIPNENYVFVIEKGQDVKSIGDNLEQIGIIDSAFIFNIIVKTFDYENKIKTGEYTLSKSITLSQLIKRFASADFEYIPVRLTIKEGQASFEIAETIIQAFPKINLSTTTIYAELLKREGRIFPETYKFAPFVTFEEILKTVDKEFNKRIKRFGIAENDLLKILTIASILEREVQHIDDMKMVSGIIQNRLAKNMRLEMDSTLGYVTGKASLQLTFDDLKLDSPYNTYKITGLPIGPIGNPGEAAIEAALNPSTHDFIFFLSDKELKNHYAKTYAEHIKNRKKYLSK